MAASAALSPACSYGALQRTNLLQDKPLQARHLAPDQGRRNAATKNARRALGFAATFQGRREDVADLLATAVCAAAPVRRRSIAGVRAIATEKPALEPSTNGAPVVVAPAEPGIVVVPAEAGLPSLPQNDIKDKHLRQQIINWNRVLFDYEFSTAASPLTDLPLLKNVPFNQWFSKQYLFERLGDSLLLLANILLMTLENNRAFNKAVSAEPPVPLLRLILNLRQQFSKLFGFPIIKSDSDKFAHLADYANIFPLLKKPIACDYWSDDRFFAQQRLSGANPIAIRRVSKEGVNALPKYEAFTKAFNGALAADIQSKIKDGTLFFVDYFKELLGPSDKALLGKIKYLPKPIALFTADSEGMGLLPFAIQTTVGDQPQVYVPFDKQRTSEQEWAVAKLCVQVADANHHEARSHLGRCHLVLQAFGVASKTCLPQPQRGFGGHPLAVLLEPHLRFLLFNNFLAVHRLAAYGGPVDELLAGTLEETAKICGESVATWRYQDFTFDTELQGRGFAAYGDADKALSYYPFRDDGKLIYDAIDSYVGEYLGLYYNSDADVAADTELQGWASMLAAKDICNVKDFPSSIATRKELQDVITVVIWTSSGLHSAVNYTQYDYLVHMPNGTLALYDDYEAHLRELATDKENGAKGRSTEEHLMELLPPVTPTFDQFQILGILSAYRYDKLGIYRNFSFKDQAAEAARRKFVAELAAATSEIMTRNAERAKWQPYAHYELLLPEKILNSTSI